MKREHNWWYFINDRLNYTRGQMRGKKSTEVWIQAMNEQMGDLRKEVK